MEKRMHIVVLSGAGMSAESGIQTFRDSNGLWANFSIEEVCTPEAWMRDPGKVLDFYNYRRREVMRAEPNDGHRIIAGLEDRFKVSVITQNIDDLHERAGSASVLHLHGEIRKARGTLDNELYDIEGTELNLGDKCPRGSQLRPHVVFFGEEVPMLPKAAAVCALADQLLIVGTSLTVYPAASLVQYVPVDCPVTVVDPRADEVPGGDGYDLIAEKAAAGLRIFEERIG